MAVPYANLTNPQTLNLYSMVADDPESFADLDGHCQGEDSPNGPSNACPHETAQQNADTNNRNNANNQNNKPPAQNQVTFSDIDNAIGKEIGNTVIGLVNLANEAASFIAEAATGQGGKPYIEPEAQPSTPGEKLVMGATSLAMIAVPESKAGELAKVGVTLREEKIAKQAETVAKYSDGALVRSARKATAQIEKHLDLLGKSASEAARSIKLDLAHNAERLEGIIREVIKRNVP